MKKVIKIILCSLIIIGALNWGLVGLFELDLVAYLLGDMSLAARIIYSIIGISALLAVLFSWIFNDSSENNDCGC
ncbi:DUF378 domain-containing protein [bacterium]|nr:DUF378 domain-containing protein [bacterium]